MRILIDPGHGGFAPGARRKGLAEKNLVLGVGLHLRRLLKAGGFEVDMTREEDRFVRLRKRAAMANSGNYDLVICIHNNASVSTKPYGDQVYVYHERNRWMAEKVLFELQRARPENLTGGPWTRTEVRTDLYMLRKTRPVTLFVEAGFISNPNDRDWLDIARGGSIPLALFRAVVKIEIEKEKRNGKRQD